MKSTLVRIQTTKVKQNTKSNYSEQCYNLLTFGKNGKWADRNKHESHKSEKHFFKKIFEKLSAT